MVQRAAGGLSGSVGVGVGHGQIMHYRNVSAKYKQKIIEQASRYFDAPNYFKK